MLIARRLVRLLRLSWVCSGLFCVLRVSVLRWFLTMWVPRLCLSSVSLGRVMGINLWVQAEGMMSWVFRPSERFVGRVTVLKSWAIV